MRDDTGYLQELLDRGGEVFVPGREYTVTKPLLIGDNTTLRLAPNAVIRLGDGAGCVLIENEGFRERRRNHNITVTGGTWDGNNKNQVRGRPESGYEDDAATGIAMRFIGVDDLTLSNLTIKDPESYATHLCNLNRFTIDHITFDFNLLRANMDGIHVNGPARFGRITNIMGATNDDLVALNCDDAAWCEPYRGDITDVEVDGLFADCGYTAVRLLSSGSTLRNVSISNIFGTYRFYAVSFTHHNIHPGEPILLENVTVRNVFASKPTWVPDEASTHYYPPSHSHWVEREPLIWFAPGVLARNITVSDVHRTEEAVTHAGTIVVDENAVVENLMIRDVTQRFAACEPVPTVEIRGRVDGLRLDNVQEI